MAGVATRRGGKRSQREDALHDLQGSVYTAVMEGRWKDVVDIYKKNKSAPTTINGVGDTILHLAILMGDQDGVVQLMELMEEQDTGRMENILQTKNDWDNTPLHQAAFMGMDKVCLFMAKHYCTEKMMRPRNKQGETPLHVAVLHGRKSAFFALQMVIEEKGWEAKDRKNDGDTILHSAIFREHFDLALEIIAIYPELIHTINENGKSALHILANKPSAFKSGIYIGLFYSFIYHSIHLKDMQLEYLTYKEKGREDLQDDRKACDAHWTSGEDDKSKHITEVEIEIPAPWTSDDDDRPKHSIDVEISEEGVKQRNQANQETTMIQNQGIPPASPNQHKPFFNIFGQVFKAIVFLLFRIGMVQEIREMKKKNLHAKRIMQELVFGTKGWQFESDGGKPKGKNYDSEVEKQSQEQRDSEREKEPPRSLEKQANCVLEVLKKGCPEQQDSERENLVKASPFLVAAKRGVKEMVVEILKISPVAALDVDSDGKNIILLAAEYRQTQIYKHMLTKGITKLPKRRKLVKEALFQRVDDQGNSALHLAARFAEKRYPWSIPGAAFQMQSEVKWYKSVEKSMSPGFFIHYNFQRETAQAIFTNTHKELVKDAREWLINTSQSCSVVAALIAAIAYTSATTVPGGNESTGFPVFESQPAFQVFAMSSLIALCFSVTALVLFLSILTSRFRELDFETSLPTKLIGGMTTLFVSIVANLVSFCAGHFYIIHNKLRSGVYILYAVMSLPVMAVFFTSQFRLYVDLIKALFSSVPERYEELPNF